VLAVFLQAKDFKFESERFYNIYARLIPVPVPTTSKEETSNPSSLLKKSLNPDQDKITRIPFFLKTLRDARSTP
jgi:hypothetical protein